MRLQAFLWPHFTLESGDIPCAQVIPVIDTICHCLPADGAKRADVIGVHVIWDGEAEVISVVEIRNR